MPCPLLDQLLAFGGSREVSEADARAMLGTVDRQQVVQLVKLLAAQDVAGLLDYARQLEQWSPDYLQLLDALVSLLGAHCALPGPRASPTTMKTTCPPR